MSSTPVAAVVASGKLAEVLPSSSAPAAAAPAASSLLSPCSRSPSTPAVSLKLVAAGHTRRIRVPADSTFEQLRWEVAELCKITPSDFTIRFQVGDEDRVMSDDRGVRLAFASAATDPSKPIRLSIDLIGRVGLNVGGGRVAVKRKESLPAAATATAPSADSGSASSSALPQQQAGAVAVAQAAIGMTANQTVPLNPQNTDGNARIASPSSTQERASSLPAPVVAPVVVAECVSPSASLARARVHAILVQPYADWSLVHVQQQMKHTAEDRALLPLVNTDMVCEEMQTIVHERQIEAKQRAAIAAAAEEREKKAKAAAASSSAIPQLASAASSSAAAVPSAPLPSESAARLRVRTILSHPHAAWTLVHVQQQMSFTSDDRALLPFVSQSMLCDEMQTIVIERQIEGKLKAAVAAAEERKVEAARVAASPFSAFAAVSSPSAAVSSSPLPVAADSSSSPSSSSSALSSARSRVREILSAPLAHCSLVHVQHLMQFTAEDRALLPLVNAAMVCEELQAIVHERQLEAKQKLAIAAAAEEKERQAATMADERKEQERQAKAAAASSASAAQLAALSESIALNPTPLPPALPVAAHAPVAFAPAPAAASCSVAPAAAAAAAPALGSWSCAVCTFVNSFPVLQCEVCLALIPEVEAPAAAIAASLVAPAVAPAVAAPAPAAAAPAVVAAAVVAVAPAAASVAVVASAVAPVVESPPAAAAVVNVAATAAAIVQPSPVQAPLVIEVEQQPQSPPAVAVASAPAAAVSPISSMSIALLPASSPLCPPAAVVVVESAASASACASSSSSSSYSSLTNSSCSAFTSPSDSPPSDDSPVQPAQDRSPQLDVHQLAEQMERLSQQLRAMQSPPAPAESGSVSSSLSSSAFLLPATPPAPALSPVELASAVSAMSLTMERMAAMQRSHIAEMQRMMAEQMEQAMKRMEAERRLVKRERSNSGKAYRTVSAAIAHRHGRRSMSGVRTQRSTSSLSSSQSSLSSSVPPSPALSSLQSSPQSAPHGAGAGVVVPSLSLISPALAPSTDHLASSLLDSRYVDLMSLSQTDLDHANQSAAASLVGLDDLSTGVEVLPVGAPALQTINSASELESMEETGSATVESFSATPLAQVLSAIPEASSSASFAALSSSSSSSSSSAPVSGSPSDLSASVDMSSVRFPSVPVVSDRESKLDELAQLGFTNRIFASTLLDANDGCMSTTIANLTQFYGR